MVYPKYSTPSLTLESESGTYSIIDMYEGLEEYPENSTDRLKSVKQGLIYIFLATTCASASHSMPESLSNSLESTQTINIEKHLSENIIIDEYSWVEIFLSESSTLDTPKALMPYYSHINDLMLQRNFKKYNEILKKVEIETLHETLIIALLRLSYMWKEDISEWSVFMQKAYTEIEKRGHNSKKLLKGLS